MTLDEIEKLCNEATEGPWLIKAYDAGDGTGTRTTSIGPISYWASHADDSSLEISDENLRFIAASRALMPKLLAVAKAAKQYCDTGGIETGAAEMSDLIYELEKE